MNLQQIYDILDISAGADPKLRERFFEGNFNKWYFTSQINGKVYSYNIHKNTIESEESQNNLDEIVINTNKMLSKLMEYNKPQSHLTNFSKFLVLSFFIGLIIFIIRIFKISYGFWDALFDKIFQ